MISSPSYLAGPAAHSSTAFYRDVFGFSVVTTLPDAAPFVFACLQRDNVNVPDGCTIFFAQRIG